MPYIVRRNVRKVYAFHEEIRNGFSAVTASVEWRHDDVEFRSYEAHWQSNQQQNYEPGDAA